MSNTNLMTLFCRDVQRRCPLNAVLIIRASRVIQLKSAEKRNNFYSRTWTSYQAANNSLHGSLCDTESSMVAFVIPAKPVSYGHRTSSARAEPYAILLALHKFSDYDLDKCFVCKDSCPAVQCIGNMRIRLSLAPVVAGIMHAIHCLEV